MRTVIFYVVLLAAAGALAWLAWGFPAVRRLDGRVLGDRGIAAVTAIAALLLLTGMAAVLLQRVWGVAAVYAVMSGWVGYWACRRISRLREAPSE